MFDTLIKPKNSWWFFIIPAASIILLPSLSLYSKLAFLLSLLQLFLLYESVNRIIPIRYLLGFLFCIQILVGPVLVYNGFEQYQFVAYRMQVSEGVYFSYALPAMVLFIIGLHFNAKKFDGEELDFKQLNIFISNNRMLPYALIFVGLMVSILGEHISFIPPFVVFLISNFKWVGVFILILRKDRWSFVPIIILLLISLKQSLAKSSFYDLFTWLLFIGSISCLVLKPGRIKKLLLGLSLLMLVVFLQSEKYAYRNAIIANEQTAGAKTFLSIYFHQIKENNGFFTAKNLAPSISRINQGFIISYVLKDVPSKVYFEHGTELWTILYAAFMPRIFAPNKMKADDMENFAKYTPDLKYPGGKNTIMCLSPLGDAYINFGRIGGCFFMFILGLFYNSILHFLKRRQRRYPLILLFLPLIFYYSIRADGSLENMLGQVFKSSIFIFLFLEAYYQIFVKRVMFKNYYNYFVKHVQPFQKEA